MFKKVIKYEDFDGTIRTEDHWFNLTAAELIELQVSLGGNSKNGFENFVRRAVSSGDYSEIVKMIKAVILKAYGEKKLDADGKERFIKNPEITNAFASTEAYSTLFVELASDAQKASEFISAIAPRSAQEGMHNGKAAEIENELKAIAPKYSEN